MSQPSIHVWYTVCVTMILCQVLASGQEKQRALVVVPTEEDDSLEASVADDDDPSAPNMEPFQPTDQWQPIKEGQSIPRGLHIRMNLQTGKKEAKLLEKEDAPLQQSDTSGSDGSEEGYSPEELKIALKKFKASADDVTDEKVRADSLKQKHRSMEELKKEFADLRMGIKTELEIIQELVELYSNKDLAVEDRIKLLTQLEYYLHQMDNAQDFVSLGGLTLIIKDLNHTEEDVRSEAAFVMGSATQSNPKVQIKALEGGVLHLLIRMLHIEINPAVRSRVIYALSSILRHFPLAQSKFLEQGGLQALASVFNQGSERLRVKAVTVVSDLLLERKHTLEADVPGDITQQEKVKQYQSVPLLEAVIEQGWCDLLPSLLSAPEHDSREKVLIAMETLVDSCRDKFTQAQKYLSDLKLEYESLSHEEEQTGGGDYYFTHILQSVNRITNSLQKRDEL